MFSATRLRIPRGFTLIELLIVIAIIAILALIAIPNFLEAQTRAKTARVKADMRTYATGIEAYFVDYNKYPPDRAVHVVNYVTMLTTPIAYITSLMPDPFATDWWASRGFKYPDGTVVPPRSLKGAYLYVNYNFDSVTGAGWSWANWGGTYLNGKSTPNWIREGCLMSSFGPDRTINNLEYYAFLYNNPQVAGFNGAKQPPCDMVYDPTNGTVSAGDIGRCMGALQCPPNLGS
ncbi:MAG: prepilin-type N-terminal cleavage/methylation domain-containing protein [Candidatus Sumerlaeota bacterium]|nr:prepilin-type N-terminal cleavage/methylation domain-containing protein [Candidatus Sumerlaeota bacterium]